MPADGMIAAHLPLEDSRHVRWLAAQHAAYSISPSVEKALPESGLPPLAEWCGHFGNSELGQ